MLNMRQFKSKISWQKASQSKKEVKLDIQYNQANNKLTMKFNSPFAGYKQASLEGTKETTSNGARFIGTANVNNVPSKIELEYSLKLNSKLKEVEVTWKGTRGSQSINVILSSKVDRYENEVEGSIVVTGSEIPESSLKFSGEYGSVTICPDF